MKKRNIIVFLLILSVTALLAFSACGKEKNELAAPQISIAGNVISWYEVENADGYEVYENGALVAKQTATTYTVSKTEKGSYKYKVKATTSDANLSASGFSNEVIFTVDTNTLAAPKISKQDKTISWNAVQHADGYEVYENGTLIASQAETSFTIEQTKAGTYRYSVKATSLDPLYVTSEFSNEVTEIIYAQLETPQISIADKVISWDPVDNATEYAVYENDIVVEMTAQTSYTITQTIVGDYYYCVVARSSDPAFRMSSKSDSVKFTAVPVELAKPDGLALNGRQFVWNEVEGAGLYNIYEDDILIAVQAHSPYVLPMDHDTGTFVYTVKALPAKHDKQYLEGPLSDPYTLQIDDERQSLAKPTGLHTELRELDNVPVSPDGEKAKALYLVWNPVENAGGYFVYEDGKRIYATGVAEYMISEAMAGEHKFQIKAVTEAVTYKSSELSDELPYQVEQKDVDFTISLDVTNALGFNSAVTITFRRQNESGLPDMSSETRTLTIPAGSYAGTVTLDNAFKYVAKITSVLPTGCYASEARLSAASPEGTISLFKTGAALTAITLDREVALTASGGIGGSVGVERFYLFIAPESGLYTLVADSSIICTVGGVERYAFTADEGEAVLIGANCQSEGRFTFKVTKTEKRYVNFGEMSYDGATGASNALYDGQEETKLYFHPSEQAVRYMFLFTTATMGNTRFVTLTINGVDYEFDGAYCTSLNILIPASETETEISVKVFGSAPEEGLSTVHFFVIPLT